MEQQFHLLNQNITEIFSKIEKRLISLENRVISLEHLSTTLSSGSKTLLGVAHAVNTLQSQSDVASGSIEGMPEPEISLQSTVHKFPKKASLGSKLRCVQCFLKFREEQNIECSCIYHSGELKFVAENKHVLTCCQVPVKSRRLVRMVPGCTKTKHFSKHHTKFSYVNYYIHMITMLTEALEVWLTVDLMDPITECCEWGEVGLSSERKVFVVVGFSREQPVSYREFSFEELRECKPQNAVILRKCGPSGRVVTVTLHSAKATAKAISVSLKAAGYKSPLVKRLQLVLCGDCFKPGSVDTLSDPTPPVTKTEYRVPVDVMRGPVLQPGQNYSVSRKSNYLTDRDPEDSPLTLTQMESITVCSSHIRLPGGKWNNLFTTAVMVTNLAETEIFISDIYAQFQQDGEWIKCDQTWLAINVKEFSEPTCISIAPRSDLTLSLRMAIAVEGALPVSMEDEKRAHFSLPQPLHLRVVFVGTEGMTASLRFEQGNTPLSLVTRSVRQASWNNNEHMAFYIFADDVKAMRRTDVAFYFNSEGVLVYRACPYGIDAGEQLLTGAMLTSAAHNAKKYRRTEEELVTLRKAEYESSVRVYALVDLELGVTHALKVFVTTPTSYSVGYCSLPHDDFSSATLSVQPDHVQVNSITTLTWSVPRASKHDTLEIYTKYGSNSLSELVNDQADITGAKQICVPSTPGEYEVRYYPAWLKPSNSAHQHPMHIVKSSLIITA